MATPHIKAERGAFAETVLMPGDPLRAKFVAERFFEDSVLVNNVRGVQGYTGTYRGRLVSVMASGMGMPSIGIYAHELFCAYGVKRILRVGSAGAMQEALSLYDVVLAAGACTDSRYGEQFRLPGTFAPIATPALLRRVEACAARLGIPVTVGNVLSSDRFYDDSASTLLWRKMGVLAVEMETAALYLEAARAGTEALAILTISDHLLTGAETTSDERERSFSRMIELALEAAE